MRLDQSILLTNLTIIGLAIGLSSFNPYFEKMHLVDSGQQRLATNKLSREVKCSDTTQSPPPGCPRRDT